MNLRSFAKHLRTNAPFTAKAEGAWISVSTQDGPDLRSRAYMVDLLGRFGITGPEAEKALDGIDFPAPLEEIYAHLGRLGIADRDSLIDEMGGSP